MAVDQNRPEMRSAHEFDCFSEMRQDQDLFLTPFSTNIESAETNLDVSSCLISSRTLFVPVNCYTSDRCPYKCSLYSFRIIIRAQAASTNTQQTSTG